MTLRTKNGKRYNWWIPLNRIQVTLSNQGANDKTTIRRAENWGQYYVTYYSESVQTATI